MRPKRENLGGPARMAQVTRAVRGLALATLIVSGLVSCSHQQSGKELRFEIKGRVVSVDRRGSTVTISHEAIPGYMEAMSMPFKLKDERLLNDLAEADRLQATLVVAGLRSWLEDVVVMRETVDPSSLSKAETSVEPKPGDEVPDFKLVDQNGKRFSFNQYRRRTVVLTFTKRWPKRGMTFRSSKSNQRQTRQISWFSCKRRIKVTIC